jgi:hypothetical protein
MYYYNPLPQHLLDVDPHPQYLTQAEGDVRYSPFSTLYLDGFAVDTFPRIDATVGRALVSGQLHLTYFTAPYDASVSNFTMVTIATAAAGLTLARIGLYSVDGNDITLEAACANDTSLFTSSFTVYTRAFDTGGGLPATFDLAQDQRYALGVLLVGSTMPNLYGNGFSLEPIYNLPPRMTGQLSSQTDLPATSTITSAANFLYWARLS